MNGAFQTARELAASTLPIEFEVLAPTPLLRPANALTTTKRCVRRSLRTSRRDQLSNGCSRSTWLNYPGKSSATASCATGC